MTPSENSQTDEVVEQSLIDLVGEAYDEVDAAPEDEVDEPRKSVAKDADDDLDEEKTDEEDEKSDDEESKDIDDESKTENEDDALAAPSEFTADEQEQFGKLDKDAQALIIDYSRRSQGLRTKATTDLDLTRKQYQPYDDVVEPYRPLLNQAGVSGQQVFAGLMPVYATLATGTPEQKRAQIKYLETTFNVPETDDLTGVYDTPEVQTLRNDVNALRTDLQQRDQVTISNAETDAQQKYEDYRDATDDNGTLLHPHLKQLEETMLGLINSGMATSIDDAYQKAAAWDPEIQKLEAVANKKAAAERNGKIVTKAKKAAAVNKQADSEPVVKGERLIQTAKDATTEAYEELYGSQ